MQMSGARLESQNFGFLNGHDPLFLRLCVTAERNYHDDPNTTVIKLRQFGEAIVKHLAAVFGMSRPRPTSSRPCSFAA